MLKSYLFNIIFIFRLLALPIIFNNFIHKITAAKIYNCFDGTVKLNFNEITYYETPGFPRLLNELEWKLCSLKFVLSNSSSAKEFKIFAPFIVISDGIVWDAAYSFLTIDNSSSLKFQDIYSPPPISGLSVDMCQKGIVIFEKDDDESCPLESISRTKPFVLNSEDEVIYIFSNYYMNETRKNSCLWKFAAPSGYGFKMVIQTFNVSSETSLKVENTTDLLINKNSVKINHPIYNGDNYLQIYLSKGDPRFITEIEFQAYISVVKKEQNKKTINCTISQRGDTITWTNAAENRGYKDDIECSYDFFIPGHSVVMINFPFFQIEQNVDYVEMTMDETRTIIDPRIIFANLNVRRQYYVFEAYKNGTPKYYSWKFVSDGSIHLRGFEIDFRFIECQCANHFLSCGDSMKTLMNLTGRFDDYYCPNLQCNVTIESCTTPFTYLFLEFNYYREEYDVFRLHSSNKTILDINRQSETDFRIYLNSSNSYVLEIITFTSSWLHGLRLNSAPFTEVVFDRKVVLSENDTNEIFYLPSSTFIEIEMEKSLFDQNISFILHASDPNVITLYYDKKLTLTLDFCFTEASPFTCIIPKQSFVLNQIYSNIVAIRLSSGSKNCVFKENIFYVNDQTYSFSAMANKNGACLITLMVYDFFSITHLWTTTSDANVKVFGGIDKDNLIFEFNSGTLKQLNDIILTLPVYTILIPAAHVLYIRMKLLDVSLPFVVQYPFKSIITTTFYGFYNIDDQEPVVTFSIKENPVKFTVLDYTFSTGNVIYFQIGHDNIVINKTGDFLIFQNQDVVLWYTFFRDSNVKNGALFLIEAYNGFDEIL